MNKNLIKSIALYTGIAGISGAIIHPLAYEIKNSKLATENYTTREIQIVDIPDANLKKGINNALGRGAVLDDITITDMENLTNLSLSQKNISNIKGLEYAINLTTLYLNNNQISDISSLRNLTNLRSLDLGVNKIINISSLNNLTNLIFLRLESNQILDISSLGSLTNLTNLNLRYNQISDISTLSNLTSLDNLNLANNQISDISSLSDLTSLANLNLNNNQISNISSLRNLIKLRELRLANNQITDILVVINFTKLTWIELNNNKINDISVLENLTNLTGLTLGNNQILDISVLKNLTNLTGLHLDGTQISDISALQNLTNLTNLYLQNNKITDISILEDLTNLTFLRLENNQISDISSISNLINLTNLNLYTNQIVDISVLENLTNLISLNLSNNKITDISLISNLINLTNLNLYTNQILDISPLSNLTKLTTLNLANQNISNNYIIKTNTKLTNIAIDNPLKDSNSNNINMVSISNNGYQKNNKLYWDNITLGQSKFTSNFSQAVQIGTAKTTFNGTVTYNVDVIDGESPSVDNNFSVNEEGFSINATITAEDLLSGVNYLMHKGVRHSLPYTFEYDVYNRENNIIEVYDTVGNVTTHEVTADSLDIDVINNLITLLELNDSSPDKISYIRTIVNNMSETETKTLLSEKINNLSFDLELERQTATSNLDLYIKCENLLLMSLDTNSITFEDFSGVSDIEKTSALNITVNSSLPYQINAYLPTEIKNSDGSNIMDKQILNIKESSNSEYKTFTSLNNKVVLKDNCIAGNGINHSIDLMLKGGIAHEKDVYKTTIKLEIEQK